jgi:O-antigen/teichoic acid export membrane protein
VAYIVFASYKIYLLATQKSVAWFAVSNALDLFVIAVILMIIYLKIGKQRLSFDWQLGRELLSRSKYYIIPSMMVMIFQQTDRIMIKLMAGEAETGFYSAAITCVSITGFLFTAVIDSARPMILAEKERDQILFEKRQTQLYAVITYMSLIQSILMTVLAKPLVYLLYGNDYAKTAGILCVAVWYVTFSHYGLVRNVWILAEGKQKYLTGINVIGAAINVVLNLCLIPLWGAVGAAVASVITQFFTNILMGYLCKPISDNNRLMIKGLNPTVIVELVKDLARRRE